MGSCFKCGLPVEPTNDATRLDAIREDDGIILLVQPSSHLLPVRDEDGEVVCVGSPSRAQYLEGQPRDTRGYPYDTDLEAPMRAAYGRLSQET